MVGIAAKVLITGMRAKRITFESTGGLLQKLLVENVCLVKTV